MRLGKSAYIKLVKGSTQQDITLDQVKSLLNTYVKVAEKTGEQLDWKFNESSFPYTMDEKIEEENKYLYLKGKNELYNYLIIGNGSEEVDNETVSYIQIVLPDEEYRTPGDQSKGTEFAKYLAQHLKAELHLFNDRVMYFNPRK